jgi:oxygen-independent coproporphyrinogen-3 oxidase
VTFESYFANELEMLKPLDADGLVQLQKRSVEVTPIGRLLARNVAMVFDKRLGTSQNNQRFSRVI